MSQINVDSQALTPAQFREQSLLLAKEIVDKVLQPNVRLRTTVAMEALIYLYCLHARTLPPDTQGAIAMALAGIAGEFLHASKAAPAGAPVH